MLFDSWSGLGHELLVGPLAYLALVAILGISGKTDAHETQCLRPRRDGGLGVNPRHRSCSASPSRSPTRVLAMALLVFLQDAIAWLAVRVSWVDGSSRVSRL